MGIDLPRGALILAPMAGYTDATYRAICGKYECNMTVTEMVSSKALVYGNENTFALLKNFGEKPCAVQIFGHEPEIMAQSVRLPQLSGFELVDINMGCPVKKIVSGGDGSALLSDPKLAGKVVSAVKNARKGAVSVKIRLGQNNSDNAENFVRTLADSGADMITVHLRTAKQMYGGKADYQILPKLVAAAGDVPIFANGDVDSREKYLYLLECGAYGVAIGRAALGKPYIFNVLKGKSYEFDAAETLFFQYKETICQKGERVVANEMKKHVAYYLKGVRNAKRTVAQICATSDVYAQMDALKNFFAKEQIL